MIVLDFYQLIQTEKEIYQNILRGYVEGNEWFLNNIKPLLNDQRAVSKKLTTYNPGSRSGVLGPD